MEVMVMGYKLHTAEEEKQMVQEYIQGVPVQTLMTKYGYKTKKSVIDKVKKYESADAITIAKKNRKNYKIEFNGVTDSFSAYFLGLMLTDGYIQDDNKFGIDLTDEDCIAFISKITGKEYKAYDGTDHIKTRYRLIFSDNKIVEKLSSYGVTQNKSKTIQGPQLTEEEYRYLPYIIRGIIDGDGCIYKTSYGAPAMYICSASYDFILWNKTMLEHRLFFKELSLTQSEAGLWRIDTANQQNILKLLTLVYDVPYGMQRKYNLLREMFRDYNKDNLLLG